MSAQVNTPEAVGWLLLAVITIAWLAWTISVLREHGRHRRIRRNDKTIFETVEEARRDFR